MKFEGGIGVKAVTTWLPETTESTAAQVSSGRLDAEASERLGVAQLPVSADLAAPEMAVLAGRKVLARAGWDPGEVGLLAHAWMYHQGREKWSAAHYVAHGLGLPASALPFGLHELCSGGTSGLFLAASTLLARTDMTAALVTTADRFGAPVWDRWLNHTDIGYGDGATAALLHRPDGSADELRLVSLTYSVANWLEEMERGKAPFSPSPMYGRDTLDTSSSRAEFYAVHGKESLREAAAEHVGASLHSALDEAGLSADDPRIRVLTTPRLGPRLINLMYGSVLEGELKAKLIQLGRGTGHLGAGDMLANMAAIAEQRMLASGEFAIIAGGGGGFTWSTAIVQAP
jgi:3-oxoacyl-[acyl-carrier-protein] synthase III